MSLPSGGLFFKAHPYSGCRGNSSEAPQATSGGGLGTGLRNMPASAAEFQKHDVNHGNNLI